MYIFPANIQQEVCSLESLEHTFWALMHMESQNQQKQHEWATLNTEAQKYISMKCRYITETAIPDSVESTTPTCLDNYSPCGNYL